MARPIMRRLPPLVLVFLVVLLFSLAPPSSSSGQESPSVRPHASVPDDVELPDRDRGPGPEPSDMELPDRARARRSASAPTTWRRSLTRRARDRGHPVLAGTHQRSAYEDLARVRPVARDRGPDPSEGRRDRPGRDAGLRGLGVARSRDRPRAVRCLPAQGRPAERVHLGRRAANTGDLPRSRTRDPAGPVVDVRPRSPDRVRAGRHLHRPVPRDRPGPGRPVERRDPRAARARVGSHGGTGRRRHLAGAADAARPDGGRGTRSPEDGETRRVQPGEGGAALAKTGPRGSPSDHRHPRTWRSPPSPSRLPRSPRSTAVASAGTSIVQLERGPRGGVDVRRDRDGARDHPAATRRRPGRCDASGPRRRRDPNA